MKGRARRGLTYLSKALVSHLSGEPIAASVAAILRVASAAKPRSSKSEFMPERTRLPRNPFGCGLGTSWRVGNG